MQYQPFIDISEPIFIVALNRLGCNVVTYWLSLPFFVLFTVFDTRITQRVMVAWEGHSHIMEVKV